MYVPGFEFSNLPSQYQQSLANLSASAVRKIDRMLRIFALISAALALLTPAAAQNMHYLVFDLNSASKATALLHTVRPTSRQSWPIRPSAVLSPMSKNIQLRRLHARAYAGESLVYADVIELEVQTRVPSAPEATHVHDVTVAKDRSAFALRLPIIADRLIIDRGTHQQTFDLRDLQAKAKELPLSGFAGAVEVKSSNQSGPPSNRVDILVIGEGYLEQQQALFAERADEFENGFFSRRPLREYRSLYNVHRLFVASEETGADHPPYLANCSSSQCCADPVALNDLRAPRFVNTAFDSTFCAGGVAHRGMALNIGKVLAAAASAPDWDVIAVLINDPTYGGRGYAPSVNGAPAAIAVGTATASAVLLMTHELGHSLFLLGDEYRIEAGDIRPYCSEDTPSVRRCPDNHTDETDAGRVKWREWFSPDLPIPTPAGQPGVGLFEGASFYPRGIYRPVDNACLMHTLTARWCPVCSEATIASMYDGRFGMPEAGIDLIEPGTEVPAPQLPVQMIGGQSKRFTAFVLQPEGETIDMQWLLDGAPITDATTDSLDLQLDSADGEVRTLELRVVDNGPFVRSTSKLPLTVHSRVWTLQVEAPEGGDFAFCAELSGAWYNPLTPGQGLFLDVNEQTPLIFAGWFTWNDADEREWYTSQGGFEQGSATATLPVNQTDGGRFDDPQAVVTAPVGASNLKFADCESGQLSYLFDDGRNGTIPLRKLLPAPEGCAAACRR